MFRQSFVYTNLSLLGTGSEIVKSEKLALISRLHGLSSSMKLISYFHKQFASNQLHLLSWIDYFLFKLIETKISVVYGEQLFM